jgi:AraC family transcriptional regulator
MFSTALPNINSYNTKETKLKENTVVFANTNNKYFYPEHKTPYLFVTNFLNKGKYVLNKSHIEISDKHFYFLNANDHLEINFNKNVPLRTLLILFEENFIENSFAYLKSSNEELLDLPIRELNSELKLPNVPFGFNRVIREKTEQLLQKSLQKEDADVLLSELITEFLLLNKDTGQQIKKINAVKKSTREELYKRLVLAKELIHDNVCENLTVEQIAKEVCLNKFHFLSNFKTVFNTTPHKYHTEKKLQKAFQLLQSKQYSVAEVCNLVGFESIGSFSNLFKRRFEISPSQLFEKV